jgi:L-lactate dehydrogenase
LAPLQVYLEAITRRDLIGIIAATDPSCALGCSFGGIDPVLTSKPVACGIPTRGGLS